MNKTGALFAAFFILTALNFSSGQQKISKKDVGYLYSLMAGSFSSELQAKKDTDYYDIRLHMKPMWKDKKEGYYLYVEQAMASMAEKPYRQRVYHVYQLNDTVIVSQVLDITDPLRFAGEWKKNNPLNMLNSDSLKVKDGCAIYLKKIEKNKYAGSTPVKACLSSLRGATYASSEVTITPQMVISWDRGYDNNDKQVWGAEKGGYLFDKLKSYK